MNFHRTALAVAVVLAGCANTTPSQVSSNEREGTTKLSQVKQSQQSSSADVGAPKGAAAETNPSQRVVKLFPGNDRVVKQDIAPRIEPLLQAGDKVSLNFESIPLGSLAHALLGDLLQLNYTIDAGSDVVVSLRTRQPLARSQVLDVLDAVLLPHDLAVVRDNAGVYHLTKRTVTLGTRPVVSATKVKELAGAGTVIAQLNYISAAEMAKILTPVAPKDALVYVDTTRNLLVLQGSKAQLIGWMDLVEAFDVDILSGMSLGVFSLEYANVSEVKDALQMFVGAEQQAPATNPQQGATPGVGGNSAAVSAQQGLLGGLVRVIPIERINALVVVTPRKAILGQVESWIRRLDRPSEGIEPGIFVYPVQNGAAVHLAELLNGLFGADGSKQSAGVAAGNAPTQFGRTNAATMGLPTTAARTSTGAAVSTNLLSASNGAATAAPPVTTVSRLEGNVRVVADEKRNALIIRAPKSEYRRIEQALKELDKATTQVLIEASIVEVSLTGNLKYGVEWFLQNGLSNGREGQALLNMRSSGEIGATQPGFSYTILNKAGVVRAALNALAEKSQVKVLSSPSVLVLDNHNATIQIGRQQPIKSATTVSSNSVVTESITYKDTGVMLSVTPSVNAGGLITMDIAQQVTDVGEIDAATGQRNFVSRQIQSKVAVRSGESIVLGGLIKENETRGTSGVPGLASIPLLGALFSTNSDNSDRTELLVLLTPRALEDDDMLRAASAELRQRMRTLSGSSVMEWQKPTTEAGRQ